MKSEKNSCSNFHSLRLAVWFYWNQMHLTQNQKVLTWMSNWQTTIGLTNTAEKYMRLNRTGWRMVKSETCQDLCLKSEPDTVRRKRSPRHHFAKIQAFPLAFGRNKTNKKYDHWFDLLFFIECRILLTILYPGNSVVLSVYDFW